MKITHKWLKKSKAKGINFVIVEKQGCKTLSPVEKILSRFCTPKPNPQSNCIWPYNPGNRTLKCN